jgi:hypothetical protein
MATKPAPKTPPYILVRGPHIVASSETLGEARDFLDAENTVGITYIYAPTTDYVENEIVSTPVKTKGKTS